jgi:hypothetical protein
MCAAARRRTPAAAIRKAATTIRAPASADPPPRTRIPMPAGVPALLRSRTRPCARKAAAMSAVRLGPSHPPPGPRALAIAALVEHWRRGEDAERRCLCRARRQCLSAHCQWLVEMEQRQLTACDAAIRGATAGPRRVRADAESEHGGKPMHGTRADGQFPVSPTGTGSSGTVRRHSAGVWCNGGDSANARPVAFTSEVKYA